MLIIVLKVLVNQNPPQGRKLAKSDFDGVISPSKLEENSLQLNYRRYRIFVKCIVFVFFTIYSIIIKERKSLSSLLQYFLLIIYIINKKCINNY